MRKVYVDTGRTTSKKEYESFSVESSFVQSYIDIDRLMFKLNSCAIHLLMWSVSRMSIYNQINLNKSMRSEFISDAKAEGRSYSDNTVKKAIRDSRIANAIVSMSDPKKRESQYMINPNFFWKTKSQNDRIDAIRGFRYQLNGKNERN